MHNEFSIENLIKGKIAELVFEEMFSEMGCTVIPFGYERAVPELRRYNKSKQGRDVINNFRDTPDFAVISADKQKIFLIEVKFRSKLGIKEVIKIAQRQIERWNPSELFIATKEGFYLNDCGTIIKNKAIAKLDPCRVSHDLQEKYLKLIQEFEK
jgi:hypothetical protein